MVRIYRCDGLAGADLDQCKADLDAMNVTDDDAMWQCVRDVFIGNGGTEQQLFKQANVGFPSLHFSYRQFRSNDPAQLEREEQHEFAYADPRYYGCLASSGHPVPFAMNDFDPATLADDQRRFEFVTAVAEITGTLAADKRFVRGTDGWRRELANRIFLWMQDKVTLRNDCVVEQPDFRAVDDECGACSEASSILFFLYRQAGLEPRFLFFHNIPPDLDWVERLPRIERAADHVFVGVPLKNGTLLQVDPINGLFDARFSEAIEVSPRIFAAFSQSNASITLFRVDRPDEAAAASARIADLAPGDPSSILNLMQQRLNQGRTAEYLSLLGFVRSAFADDPWAQFQAELTEGARRLQAMQQSGVGAAELQEENTRLSTAVDAQFRKIIATNPQGAAILHHRKAQGLVSPLLMVIGEKRRALEAGEKLSAASTKKLLEDVKAVATDLFMALLVNPHSLFAYRDLEKVLTAYQELESLTKDDIASTLAVDAYRKLLAKYPDHVLFRHSLVGHLMKWAAATDSADDTALLIAEAHEHALTLVAGAPGHPLAHEDLAGVLISLGLYAESLGELATAKKLATARGEPMTGKARGLTMVGQMLLSMKQPEVVSGIMPNVDEAFADDPENAGKALVDAFLDNFDWRLFKPDFTDAHIAEHTLSMDKDSVMTMGRTMSLANAICNRTAASGSAGEKTDAMRAYLGPPIALFAAPEELTAWRTKIGHADSPLVQEHLAKGLRKLLDWMGDIPAGFDEALLRRLETFAGASAEKARGETKREVRRLYVQLFRQYAIRADAAGAARVFDALNAARIEDPTAIFGVVDNLIMHSKANELGIRRIGTALDVLWERRRRLGPEARAELGLHLKRAAAMCGEAEMPEEEARRKKQAQSIMKP